MFIGAYLCTGSLVIGAGVLIANTLNKRSLLRSESTIELKRYLFLSIIGTLTALALFIVTSLVLDIMETGRSTTWSYPQDYLANGLGGWMVMILPIIGINFPMILIYLSLLNRKTSSMFGDKT